MNVTADQLANLYEHIYWRKWVWLLQRNRGLLEGRRRKA